MQLDTIRKYNLENGDYIELYTWEELLAMSELEEENPFYQIKNKHKRYVLPNSWRLFEEESHKYGDFYKVRNCEYSDFYKRLRLSVFGKGEVNYLEVKNVYKYKTGEWYKLMDELGIKITVDK